MDLGDRVTLVKPDGNQVPCRVLGQKNGVLMVCREDNTGDPERDTKATKREEQKMPEI